MLFQETPPDTSIYMVAGYAIFSLIMVIYLVSLMLRRRNLEQDLNTLEAMQADSNALQSKAPRENRKTPKRRAAKAQPRKGAGGRGARKK